MQIKAVEEELERARMKARLWQAAESELTWERRNDFDVESHEGEEEEEAPHPSLTNGRPTQSRQSATPTRA